MTRSQGRWSRVRRNNRGFTLLEVMVAVAILAFVLISLQGLNNRSVQDVILSERITTATLLARRVMTETLLATPLVPKEEAGEFPEEDFTEYSWQKTISPTPLKLILEVRVAVLWKEGGRQEMVELVSYE
jgi:general secretion pathway protein I